jgi:phospholipase/carboxylesterase
MNRIQQQSSLPELPFEYDTPYTSDDSVFAARSSRDDERATFVPLHYERKYAYPLIVWLHGPEDNESQLVRVMPLLSMRNYVAVAPRGTVVQSRQGKGEYCWQQAETDISSAEQRVMDSIEHVQDRLNIAPQRIFLAGFSCGGTMAMRIAMNHPEKFAGVLSLGGAFPQGNCPLTRLKLARQLPLFIGQGRQSSDYPESRLCQDLRLLHSAGMSISLRQYPCGDDVTTQMLSDVDDWIMEQVTGIDMPASEQSCEEPGSFN